MVGNSQHLTTIRGLLSLFSFSSISFFEGGCGFEVYVFHTDGCPQGGLCCGQELSGMDQEWSGKLFLKNCWVIAGNCCLKTKPMGSAGRTVLWSGIVGNGPGMVRKIIPGKLLGNCWKLLFKNYCCPIKLTF